MTYYILDTLFFGVQIVLLVWGIHVIGAMLEQIRRILFRRIARRFRS